MSIPGLEIGREYTFSKTVGEVDITMFAGLTGDFADAHINERYMAERSTAGGRIAHGALLVGYMSTVSTLSIAHIVQRTDLAEFPVSLGYDGVRFLKPVRIGDTVTVRYRVASFDDEKRRSVGEITVVNQRDETVAVGRHLMAWARSLARAGS